MTKFQVALLVIIFCSTLGKSQVEHKWSKNMGSSRGERGYGVAVDSNKNVFVTGYFQDTADFNPAGTSVLLASSGSDDIFLAKFDSNGGLLWAHGFGGPGYDSGNDIALDPSGNVYIVGDYSGKIDFDASPDTNFLESNGSDDVFLVKFNNNGTLLWANTIGGADRERCYSLSIDGFGNAYVAGYFQDTADFDPDTMNQVNHISMGSLDAFVAKYDPSGSLQWVQPIGGPKPDYGLAVATTILGEAVYLAGIFYDTVYFDSSSVKLSLTSKGPLDSYLAKYSKTGQFQWAFNLGDNYSEYIRGLTTDIYGAVYLCGDFRGTIDFDPSSDSALLSSTTVSAEDIFVAKYDSLGNYVLAFNIGGTGTDRGTDIALDKYGNLNIIGSFSETVDFDPSIDSFSLTSNGSSDIFVAQYGSNGTFNWAIGMGGTNADGGHGIITDAFDNVYGTGGFRDRAEFDVDSTQSDTLTSVGGHDIFVTKYHQFCVVPVNINVIQSQDTLTASSLVGAFQWVDCDNGYMPIPGAVNKTFIPQVNGNYSVIITDGVCTDTSACYAVTNVGVERNLESSQFLVYPNPVKNIVNLSMNLEQPTQVGIILFDGQSRIISSTKVKTGPGVFNHNLNIDQLSSGVYFLRIETNQQNLTRKLMIKR